MTALSKSRFRSGLQCLKRLYWQVFPPEELVDEEEEFDLILVQGQEVGELARQAFPGGVLVEESHEHLGAALKRTRALTTPTEPFRGPHCSPETQYNQRTCLVPPFSPV